MAAGFSIDSSASAGEFGTSTWRVGAPFGANVFWLAPTLLEVAPCWSLDCGAPTISRSTAHSGYELLSQTRLWPPSRPGALVTVLHFDHLFRDLDTPGASVIARIDQRIDRLFQRLRHLRRCLRVKSVSFDGVEL
jgi:hypothetical protein